MKRTVLALASIAIILTAGCAGTPASKESTQAPTYPEDRYLTAIGYGDSPAAAVREARGAMAAIFSSTVYAETMAQASSAFGLDGQEQFQKQVASTVKVISNVALEGVQVVPREDEADKGVYSALAVLDRRQAAARWQQELASAAGRLDAELAALPSVKGILPRLAALNRITDLALAEKAVASRLRVVGGSTAAVAEPADLRAVAAELAVLRQKTTFAISLSGEAASEALPVLRAALSREGIRLAEDTATAAGRIIGTAVLQPLNIDNPTARFVRAVITADIVDAGTGIVLKSVTVRVRKAHADETEAARMAVHAAAQQAAGQIAAALGKTGGDSSSTEPL